MIVYDFFLKASKYTFDEDLVKKLNKFAKGRLPKSIVVDNKEIYFKKLDKSISIDSDPILICKCIKEISMKKRDSFGKLSLSEITKNKKALASVIYHFSKKYQTQYNIRDEQRKELESFIEYEYTRKRLKLNSFVFNNNELVNIKGLNFKNNKFLISDK